MILTMLVGCGDKTTDGAPETQERRPPSSRPPKGEEEDDEFDITEILPSYLNYDKKEVTLCVRGDEKAVWEIGLEDDGDALSSELFERTGRTEERLNVVLAVSQVDGWSSYNNAVSSIRNSIMNQQAIYDIIVGLSWRIPQLASEGLYYNLHSFDYFDASNIWWSQSLAKELTVNERMFMATGDISIDYMESAHTVFFNQTIAKAMGMDYSTFYQTVSKGEWTFSELYEVSKDGYANLNGNDFIDDGDQFGLMIQTTMLQAFYTAAGVNLIENNGVDRPAFNVNVTQLEQVWDGIKVLLDSNATVFYENNTTGINGSFRDYFAEGKALFMITTLGSLKSLTDMTDSFGVLPMPKYNEEQTNYYSQLHGCELWSVPMDAKDPDMSAAVMTSMGYDSHEVVLEPHFEKLLKTRYVKDSESGYMIDTIYYNIYMNFDSIYNEVLQPGPGFGTKAQMPMFLFGAIADGTYGSASAWWTANESGLKLELEAILVGFYD